MGQDDYSAGKIDGTEDSSNISNVNENVEKGTVVETKMSKIDLKDEQQSATSCEMKITSKLEDHIEKLRSGISFMHKNEPSETVTISLQSTGFDETSLRLFYLNSPVPDDVYKLIQNILEEEGIWEFLSNNYASSLIGSKLEHIFEKLENGIIYSHKTNASKEIVISLKSFGFDKETLQKYYVNNPVPITIDALIKDTFEKQGIWKHISENYVTNSNLTSKLDVYIEKLRTGVKYMHKYYPAQKRTISLNTEGLDEATLRVYYIDEPVSDDFEEFIETHIDLDNWELIDTSFLEQHIKALNVGIVYPHKTKATENFIVSLRTPGFDIPSLKFFYLNRSVPEEIHDFIEDIFQHSLESGYF